MKGAAPASFRAAAVDISVVHPFDPWSQGIGGFDTFLDGFLRRAPAPWRLEVIGVTRDARARPPGRRTVAKFGGRELEFVPALAEPDPYVPRRLPLSLRFARSARLRRLRPRGAIVQYHRFESLAAVGRGAASRAVCFLHNHPPELVSPASDVRWRRLPRVFDWALERGLSRVDAVCGVDPRTPDWAEERFPHLRGNAFEQAVWADPEIFRPGDGEEREQSRAALRRRLGLAPDDPICLFAGRLESQKDPLALIHALAPIAARQPRLVPLFVGAGRLREAIAQRAAERGLGPRLRWLGWQSRERLAAIYRGADLSVCCSAFESGPRSVFESLACGCPVVSFDVGQVAEALSPLSDLGLLIERGDVCALGTAIERTLARGRERGLSERCASAVADATPANALRDLFERYSQRLGPGRRSG